MSLQILTKETRLLSVTGVTGPILFGKKHNGSLFTGCCRISMSDTSQIDQGMIKRQNTRHCVPVTLKALL